MKRSELAIVGGGVVGAFAAFLAAERGLKVTVVEAGHLGNGASGKCAGIHTTQLVIPIDIELSKRSQEIYRKLAGESVVESGFLSIEPSWISRYSTELLSNAGVRYKVLSCGELKDWIDWIRIRDYEVGVLTPEDIVLDVAALFKSLRERLEELNVSIYEWSEVTGIDVKNKKLFVDGGRERISYDYALFATGAWNKDLLDKSGVWRVPVLIYACQVLSLNTVQDLPSVPLFLEESHVYMRRFGRNSVIVGNGYALKLHSPSECPLHPSKEFADEISQKLFDRLKQPERYFLAGGWAGVCSSSPDGRPIVGRIPGYEDLFIVDALDGYGLMRGPALSQDVVGYIASGNAPPYLEDFSPSRFNNYSGEPETVIELHSRA
ncbi:MAG: FAD-binding oxidoreductase [Nitrososphaerota archaeon]|nr:FAD-binding oxidoreductase [Candidatus Calditenuaceae archaeon]MDW8073075.1 FAD-binding oxidoreductase [Nitrososphaerota archaeon]